MKAPRLLRLPKALAGVLTGALVCVVTWLAVAPPTPVLAHASVVQVLPGDGSVVDKPPKEVQLWFNQVVVPSFSDIKLIDAHSQQTTLVELHLDPSDAHILVAKVPETIALPDGEYNLTWTILAPDGHYTRGYSVFGIGKTVLGAATAQQPTEARPAPVEAGLRVATYALLALIIGCVATMTFIFRASDPEQETLRRSLIGCGALFMFTGVAWLMWQNSQLAGSEAASSTFLASMTKLLTGTRWGQLWLVRQALTLALVLSLVWPWGRGSTLVACVWVLAICVAQAAMGHAADLQASMDLAIAASAGHMLAAGLWLGSLGAMVIVAVKGRSSARQSAAQRSSVPATTNLEAWARFTPLALIGAGLLGVTGLYNTARQVQSPDALIGTLYGQALIVKLVFVALAALLGFRNMIRLHPSLSARLARVIRWPKVDANPTVPTVSARAVTAELVVAGLIMMATSVLTAGAPAHGPEFNPPMTDTSPAQTVDDLLIVFTVKPNRPGQNLFIIEASSSRRPEPAPIARVILRMKNLDRNLDAVSVDATQIDKYRYQVGGTYLSLPGRWAIQVIVRRKGLPDVSASFDWSLPSATPRRLIVSNLGWEDPLTTASAIAGVVGLVLTIAALLGGSNLMTQALITRPR